MAKLSREITGKVRACLFVLSALSVQGPGVARLLQEKLEPLAGDEPSTFLAQIRDLSRLLKAALDLMVGAFFEDACNSLVDAFTERAAVVYDRNNG